MSASLLRPSLAAAVLVGLAARAPAMAAAEDWQLHGILAQGYTLSDDNNVNGESRHGGGSFDFREIAVNASWRPVPRLLLAAQAASVQRGEVTDDDPVLDYLLADVLAHQGNTGRLGLRAGRLKLPMGFFNDSRDAVSSRPGILMPQSIYLDNDGARAFGYFSGWGAGLYGDGFYAGHSLSFQLLALTEYSLEDSAEISILRQPASGRFRHDEGYSLRLLDDIQGGRWRAALTLSRNRLSYRPGQEPPFDMAGDFLLHQAFVSLQHNRERISLTTEIVRRRIELDDLISAPQASSQIRQDSMGYYLQARYRLPGGHGVYLRYDERLRELQDRGGHGQSQATGLPRHYFFARDWTVGGNLALTPRLGLWLEVHLVDGALWVNPLDNPGFARGSAARHWSLLTAMLAYRF